MEIKIETENCDCFMYLSKLKDGEVDLILIDPPYNIGVDKWDKWNKKEDYFDETETSRKYPIVVLINGTSASSSEILASALKDSYGAVLVGEKSYGKGKVQQTVKLNDGAMAKYTSAKWLRPSGDCVDGKGLIPDYEVVVSEEESTTDVDIQLNKAIEVIGAM